ncbi:hypothetical protein [Schumannella sp. 10F1B-5-1]|uniref:hypothetical protein n=1 Tax=Schumannella sp. 10F1B-5-1 TaxID=2590780 RepID=UPI001131A6E9|nr:hypothetical protein [Schumannella sp. 10F1B-5-1]TPW71712.1 hypothetical protein FJ658_10235 [Schumannella sp. 10F1B-5-1]
MSGATSPSDPDARRPEYVVALFATVLWAAVDFAAAGMLAVLLDREPIPAGVSLFYAPLATAVAGVAVWFVTARSTAARRPWLSAAAAAAAVYLVLVLGAGFAGLRLVVAQAVSPFVLVAVALAAATVIATWFGIRAYRRPRGSGTR